MFFGGNKNILGNKLGFSILAIIFVFGVFFTPDNARAQSIDDQISQLNTEVSRCEKITTTTVTYGPTGPSGFAGDTVSFDSSKSNCTISTQEEYNQKKEQLGVLRGQKRVSDAQAENERKEDTIKSLNTINTRHSLALTNCFNPDGSFNNNNTDPDTCKYYTSRTPQGVNDSIETNNERIKDLGENIAKNNDEIEDIENCGWGNITCGVKKGAAFVVGNIANAIIAITGLILRAASILLNATVQHTIIGMSDFLKDNEAVRISWTVIRDLINILFIFGLLYISISTIINGIGKNTKTLLVNIIISALLINFSYFFTSVLIDASNFLSIEINEQLSKCEANDTGGVFTQTLNLGDNGVANCFISELKLSTTLTKDSGGFSDEIIKEPLSPNGSSPGDSLWAVSINSFIAGIFGGFFILVTSFVFVAISIMLIIRFVVLVILLITSPVVFLGWVLPNFAGISKKWSKALQDNLLWTPFAFLFLFITLSIAKNIDLVGSGTGFETVINYVLLMTFMLASVIIAKKLGASAAEASTSKAGNLIFGTSAKLGRTSIGRGFTRAAGGIKGNGLVARTTRGALKSVGSSTFDARRGAAFSGVGKATGINLGSGQSKGFDKLEEKRVEDRLKVLKNSGKPTRGEAIKIDKAKNQLEVNPIYLDANIKIENSNQAIQRAKKVMNKNKKNKESSEYKTAQNVIKAQERMIEKEQTRINETEEMQTINRLEEKGRMRQAKEAERMTNGWLGKTFDGAEQDAARQFREENNKNASKSDTDKMTDKMMEEFKKINKDLGKMKPEN